MSEYQDAPEPGAAIAEQPAPSASYRTRPVLVTGASGCIGTHCCRELTARGWKVRALVRNPLRSAAHLLHLPLEIRVGDIRDDDAVRSAIEGAGAVVHLAAIAEERGDESYEEVNVEATGRLLAHARAARIERFVHLSWNGASSRARCRLLRAASLAEHEVSVSDRKWTILSPSLVFGHGDAFTEALASLARLSPVIFLPALGRARVQPVAAEDVARAVAATLEKPETIGRRLAIGGPRPLTVHEIVERLLLAMEARRLVVRVPSVVLRPFVALVSRLLPRAPVTTTLFELLAANDVVADNALPHPLGIPPLPFAPEELLYLRRHTTRGALRALFERA